MLVRRSKTKKIVEWMLERPARVIVASFLFIMAIGTSPNPLIRTLMISMMHAPFTAQPPCGTFYPT